MEKLGVIRQVDHAMPWCAPMVIAKKKNDEIRICVDYGQLNQKVIQERVIMQTKEENLAKLKLFSKLNANAGYWQTPLAPALQDSTTFMTPFGRFQLLRLPSGIATAPEFLQREMLCILKELPGPRRHRRV
uniref:Putative gypsy nogag n=1 Tax=Ixodes ricinus TaxID=34613 RepID=A0A0K8RIQ6_IXORI